MDRQAAAIFGQPIMAGGWIDAFNEFRIAVGAVVYKDEDLVNAKHPLLRALQYGIVVANGHDAVYDPVSEVQIIIYDNDRLAVFLATEIDADLLVLLTDIADGVLDWQGKVIRRLRYDEQVQILQAGRSAHGIGGIETKLAAARDFASLGHTTVIAGGRIPDVLLRILAREEIGTWIVPG